MKKELKELPQWFLNLENEEQKAYVKKHERGKIAKLYNRKTTSPQSRCDYKQNTSSSSLHKEEMLKRLGKENSKISSDEILSSKNSLEDLLRTLSKTLCFSSYMNLIVSIVEEESAQEDFKNLKKVFKEIEAGIKLNPSLGNAILKILSYDLNRILEQRKESGKKARYFLKIQQLFEKTRNMSSGEITSKVS